MYRLKRHRLSTPLAVLLLIALVGVIFQGHGLADVPSWITTPPKEKDAIVVVGVATATVLEGARQAAILDASRQVAEYIATSLQVRGEKVRTEVEHRLMEEMKFSSEKMPLHGGLLREWFFREVADKYQSFVLVHYKRKDIEEIKSRLQSDRAALITRVRGDIQQGDAAWKRGELSDALRTFSRAMQGSYEATYPMLQSETRNRITSLLQSLSIIIVSGDRQEVKSGGKLQPLVVRITSLIEGMVPPAEGLPVRFSWGDTTDKKTVSVITDASGEAMFKPEQTRFAGSVGIYHVLAEIDNEAILNRFLFPSGTEDAGEVREFLSTDIPGVSFVLKVIPAPHNTRVLILVEESNMGHVTKESIVMQSISQSLQQAGFRVVAAHEIGRNNVERLQEAIRKEHLWPIRPELSSQVQLVVSGTASTRRGSSNMGLAISSHADAFIRVVNMKNGAVVAQKNLTGVVGFGDTLQMAGISALEKAGSLVTQTIVDQLILWEEVKGHD